MYFRFYFYVATSALAVVVSSCFTPVAENECSERTCDGCCEGSWCRHQNSAEACGRQGATCERCVLGNECDSEGRCLPMSRDASEFADGGSFAPDAAHAAADAGALCSPASCAGGCCDGQACRGGATTSACGIGGAACTVCKAGQQCVMGACLSQCTANTCSGCCDGFICRNGDETSACAVGGLACRGCLAGEGCVAGACVPPCTSANCSGCCDGYGCLPGDQVAACGQGANTCIACAAGKVCVGGACITPCSASCAGCCDGQKCRVGDELAACGLNGVACQACAPSQICDGYCGVGQESRVMSLLGTDLIYVPQTKILWVSVPTQAATNSDTLVPIDPETGQLGNPLVVGGDPCWPGELDFCPDVILRGGLKGRVPAFAFVGKGPNGGCLLSRKAGEAAMEDLWDAVNLPIAEKRMAAIVAGKRRTIPLDEAMRRCGIKPAAAGRRRAVP